jgi:hypothetical protein
MEEFIDIRITGVTAMSPQRDPTGQTRGGALRSITLGLAPRPPADWCRCFASRWERTFYLKKRDARASGDSIVIECTPEEIDEDHRPMLMQAVAGANEDYRPIHAAKVRAKGAAEARRVTDEQLLEKLKAVKF